MPYEETEKTKLLDDSSYSKQSHVEVGQLFALAKPEKWTLISGTVALVLSSLSMTLIPFIVGRIIDATQGTAKDEKSIDEAKHNLLMVVILLGGIIMFSSLFATLRSYLFTIAGERVVATLRKRLFSSIITQEIAFFDETKSGELLNRLSSDCTVIQNTVTVNISMALRSLINFIGSTFMLFYTSWKLTFISLSLLPLILFVSFVYGKFVKGIAKQFQDALAGASDNATEAITNVRTVRSFANEEGEMHSYARKIDVSLHWANRKGVAVGLFAGMTTFLANISICGILYYGGVLVINEQISTGKLASFLLYTLTTATSVGTITGLWGDLMNAVGASERVFQLLERKPKVHWKDGEIITHVQGKIVVENVSFSYPSRPDVTVLDGIDLSLDPGKVIALVGPSGQGKSTIVSLLEMFYYPNKGRITLDGQDIAQMDPRCLRRNIGYVSQEPILFGCSISDNISYGMSASPQQIEQVHLHSPLREFILNLVKVAKLANAHEFIEKFPDGYMTLVGERGVRLSGGQKQRIAIARSLLKNPAILLLDEATSALDSESEHLVQQALDTLMKGRTVLVVAHRLSTVRNADQMWGRLYREEPTMSYSKMNMGYTNVWCKDNYSLNE
ncbi:ABC transporter B family member 1-like [Planoprotostelium fungivorum]|uniref:ABC transporter B family member 1-like n=1 Tax=Planoprotostelium fungivorum TaxID=1890364 RepID=A0A2P6NZX2_9EUKA|nr:ABC transporter B family member 1-like [Planoprotostelium fungivorum]